MNARIWILASAAFIAGTVLAQPEPPARVQLVDDLLRRDAWLARDMKKVQLAVRDILEIRKMREEGGYHLNQTEKKMERQGRKDLHIFTERIRNDTLEVLAIYDKALDKPRYIEPLRRVFGKRLDNVVAVEWFDQSIEAVLGELEDGYGVPIVIRGDLETKMTVSLEGEMSLLAILLYIENAYDARLVVEKGKLWLEPLMADEGVKPIEQKPAKNKKDG